MAYLRAFTNMSAHEFSTYRHKLQIVETKAVQLLNPTLGGKRLGRGSFCSVYPALREGEVIRFNTAADVDADYLRSCSEPYFSSSSSLFRPRVIDTCDEVNEKLDELTESLGIPRVHVVVMEQLERLKDRSVSYHTNKLLHMLVANGSFPDLADKVVYDQKYVDKWLAHPMLAGLDTFAEELALFCADYELRLDKVSHDLMIRPTTGHLVVSDPVMRRTRR